VNIEDLSSFDNASIRSSRSNSSRFFDETTTEVADKVTNLRPDGEEEIQDIQVRFSIVYTTQTRGIFRFLVVL